MVQYKGFFNYTDKELKSPPETSLHYLSDSSSKYDMCRFIHATISVFLFFSLHLSMEKINVSGATNTVYITIILLLKYVRIKNKRMLLRISCVIILWLYLLSPIIRTLTEPVCTDTIYLYFFVFNVIYCIDLTKTSILNDINKAPAKKLLKSRPLSIDDTYINYITHNICTLGYKFNILASTLLCSRYKEENKVTFLLLCNLILFIVVPYIKEKKEVHKIKVFTIAYMIVGTVVTYCCDMKLFLCYCVSMYGTLLVTYLFIDLVNQYIRRQTSV